MDKPNNREPDDQRSHPKESESDSVSGSVGGSYYYDDSTGYEVYEDDQDEPAGDDPNRNRDEDKLTTEDTEKNEK